MTRYPRLNKQSTNKVSIPLLDGGINTKDNATQIPDNQLTDACNVWFDGQSLKTRPKITKDTICTIKKQNYKEIVKSFNIDYKGSDLKVDIELIREEKLGYPNLMVRIYDFEKMEQHYLKNAVDLNEGYTCDYGFRINAFLGAVKEDTDLGIYILVDYWLGAILLKGYYPKRIYKVTAGDNGSLTPQIVEVFRLNLGSENRNVVEIDELYKPLVYINGKGNKYSYLPITSQTEYANASMFEGKNSLPSAMRFQFMTDGISNVFELPIKKLASGQDAIMKINVAGTGLNIHHYKPSDDGKVDDTQVDEIVLTLKDGNYSTERYYIYEEAILEIYDSDGGYTVTSDTEFDASKSYYKRNDYGVFSEIKDTEIPESNLIVDYEGDVYNYTGDIVYSRRRKKYYESTHIKAYYDAFNGLVRICNWSGGDLILPMSVNNNIEITAYKHDFSQFSVMMNMDLSVIYGGGQGIFGGTRTFLAGYKNKICWSNSDEPTYFSENNYVGVGDNATITAFGKKDNILVIFKKNSTYYTMACSGEAVTAEQVQNGEVVDVSTTYAYFPIYQISDEYGCDLPNTVKLCLNRLIFANSGGDVYCLVTNSNTSQRNIYCLSGQIRRKMFNESNKCLLNKNAFATALGDYYMLFCGDKAWVMNYNKDSYRYIYSYTNKTNNLSTRYFTWWYWDFGNNTMVDCITVNQRLYLINYWHEMTTHENADGSTTHYDGEYDYHTDVFKMDLNESESDCECYIKTKVFDFSVADRYKKIEKLFLNIGNDIPANITLTIETDKGEVYIRPIEIECNSGQSRFTADYGSTVRLIPYCNKIKQFAIKLEAQGVMSIEKIYIYYKMLSEVIE